ncbi:MAG TPA: LPS export ABC transporter permease LptF [Geminicoccus sp.]|jgi:lipopolysaccharide export system permease protein|uniref:LPS export ABC transporter permease LptF n=1 Tax=Geminicoccus sp. TaxID=2024832 RepID=UPI002E32DE36|nr:LPS export ABC transporter permease LptF [Geminicoccus sp.]HEX2527486.1 LPS export ABC transporter permease LptF [Geminicoccus sp.]
MPVYVRYLLSQLAVPTVVAVIAVAGAVWLSQSLRLFDLIVNKGLPVTTFLWLTALLFPSLLLVVLPLALLVSTIFTYARLWNDSELVALKASGRSDLELARPALYLAAGVTLVCYVISLWLMPAGARAFKDLEDEIRNTYTFVLLQEGVFNTPAPGITVYVDKRLADGSLTGLLVHDSRDPKAVSTITAERGVLVTISGEPQLVLESGTRQEREPDSRVSALHFDAYTVDLTSLSEEEAYRWRKPKERYLGELLWPGSDVDDQKNFSRLVSAAHDRLTTPMAPFVLVMIALAVLLPADLERRGYGKRIALAIALATVQQVVQLAATSFSITSLAFVPLFYLAQIVPVCIAWLVLSGRLAHRRSKRALPPLPATSDRTARAGA